MSAEYFWDVEQNTPEWLALRLGIPTTSAFKCLLMSGKKKGEPSETRRKYLLRLAGERITGELEEGYSNASMDRGHIMEPEAVDLYAMLTDTEPKKVGFIRNGELGGSPDRVVGNDGLLQIKTAKPSVLLDIHEKGGTDDHLAQVQGEIWVAEREWNDLLIYWPGLPPHIHRYYRDEAYIKRLSEAADAFLDELHALTIKYGAAA